MIATSSEYRQSGGGPRTPVAILTVRDTGHGMPPETVAQTFEPFFTTKPIGQGTGLGLSVVQGIVVQAGGEIAVETGVGRGTTFTISLPLAAAGPVVDSSVPFNLTSSGGETILIAEDEEDLREMVTLALERHGYRVLSAANGPMRWHWWMRENTSICCCPTWSCRDRSAVCNYGTCCARGFLGCGC